MHLSLNPSLTSKNLRQGKDFARNAIVAALQIALLGPTLFWMGDAAAQSCSASDPDDNIDGQYNDGGSLYDSGGLGSQDAGEGTTPEGLGSLAQSSSAPDYQVASNDVGDYGDGAGAFGDPSGGDSGFGGDGGFGGGGEALDPVNLGLADKYHVQVDYRSLGAAPLNLSRVYHSNTGINTARVTVPMGAGWHNYYDRSLQVISSSRVRLHRANGRTLDFTYNGSTWAPTMPGGMLSQVAGGWQYVNNRNVIEAYDTNGRLLSLSSAGLVTTLQYDGTGRLVGVANPFGRTLGFGYDSSGRVSTVTLPDNSTLGYGYDANNNLITTRFADNSVRQYAYENSSFPNALTGVVDESGNRRLTWGYDAQGRPNHGHYGRGTGAVDAVYNGNQVTTTDARGTQRSRSFTTLGGRPVMTALATAATSDSAASSWSFGYDSNGNPTTVQSRSGETRQYSTDSRGRINSAMRAAGTSLALQKQTTWDPMFHRPRQSVSRGVTHDYTVDAAGRVTQTTRTAGGTTTMASSKVYNSQNLLQSVTDSRGATTSYTYDSTGNLATVTDAMGNVTAYGSYNAHGQPGRIQRADGTVITNNYDARARLGSSTVAGATTSYAYDAAGRLSKRTAADGSWRTFNYDSGGFLMGYANDRNETTTMTRDATGAEVQRATYSAGNSLSQMYKRKLNAVGQVSASVDSRNYSTQYAYGTDGRLASTLDAAGMTRSQQLDVLSRPTSYTLPNTTAMQQAGGPATVSVNHSYDNANNYTSFVDTNVVATGYSFDGLNRGNGESSPDSGGRGVVRNAAGDVTSSTDARGTTVATSRDTVGRVTALTSSGHTYRSYAYVAGRSDALLSSMSDDLSTTNWTYDSVGRLLTQRESGNGPNFNVTVARDSLGRPVSVTYPSGMVVGINYAADVVSSMSVNGGTLLTNVAYRPQSQTATSWSWGNGTFYGRSFDADGRITAVSLGSVQRSYGYDAAGRITLQTDTQANGSQQSSTFDYDEAGQLISYAPPSGASQAFTYDPSGNRHSQDAGTYSYVAHTNRLSQAATPGVNLIYQYNADGSPSSDGTFAYTYDVFGRLASASTSTLSVKYTYNALGMRTSKSVSTYNGGAWTPTNSIRYVYDDQGELIGEYDSISGYQQETVWFNGQPVGMVQGGTLYYIDGDNLGTPRSILRARDGAELWRWDSDPFGTSQPTAPNPSSGSIVYNLRFPGQVYDGETGTHYNGMRDYVPLTGRYLESDPIGMKGGVSRFNYAKANPLNNSDINGLQTIFAGTGANYIAGYGMEGSGGVFYNFSDATAGLFMSGGSGTGFNVGTNTFFGYYQGDLANFASPNTATNYSLLGLNMTIYSSGGSFQGFTLGGGPGLPVPGVSVTNTNTVVTPFTDLLNNILPAPSMYCPG